MAKVVKKLKRKLRAMISNAAEFPGLDPHAKPIPLSDLQADRIAACEKEVALLNESVKKTRQAALVSVQADILKASPGKQVVFLFDEAGAVLGYQLTDPPPPPKPEKKGRPS